MLTVPICKAPERQAGRTPLRQREALKLRYPQKAVVYERKTKLGVTLFISPSLALTFHHSFAFINQGHSREGVMTHATVIAQVGRALSPKAPFRGRLASLPYQKLRPYMQLYRPFQGL